MTRLQIDLPIAALGDGGDAVRAAEEGGIDGVWTTEVGHDPYLPLAPAALATSRIALGTAIAVAFPRSPLVHAQTAWDLQRASGGRFLLGLGAQVRAHNEKRYGVSGDHPVGRMTDMVHAIRAIWTSWQEGGKLAYEGPFYRHTLMTPFFTPAPLEIERPYPPIYLAAVSESMIRAAARVADGIHIHPLHTASYLASFVDPLIAQEASARTAQGPVAKIASVMIAMGGTDEDIHGQREFFRGQIAFYASTPAYRHVLDADGYGDLCDELHRMSRTGQWAEMASRVPDDLLDAVTVSGRWEELPSLLWTRYGGVLDRLAPYGVPDVAKWCEVARAVSALASGDPAVPADG